MWRSLLPLVLLLALAPRGRGQEEPRVTVFLALEEPGAVAVRAAVLARGGAPPEAAAAGIRQLHRNRAAQERLRRMLAAAGIPTAEVFPMLRLANGLAVVARGGDLEGLARLPEVRSVQPVALVHRANAFSAPWLGAQAAWSREDVPLTGAGLRVGIIDTGIDYLHADFGGPGTPEAYEANDPESLEEGTFPTAKVAGGWDFAGTEYGYSQEPGVPDKLVPVPDPDPLDQDGHGTHVAGSVAGFGVDAAGATFPGPWDGSFAPADLRIGPGMAPEATLYALKVFGDSKDSTASALTTAALEWAVDPDGDGDLADRLDVVNISLGADFGIGGGYEKEVYASAVAAGVLVVAAAGNSGDVHLVTSDPCAAEGIVCVASCAHDGTPYPGLWVDAPDSLQGIWLAQPSSYGPALTDQDLTGELTAAEPPLACGPLVNGEALAGRIALVDRGECSFSQKVLAAQAAGALAVVGIHNEDGIPWPSSGNPAGVAIPSVMIRKADGAIFREALSQGPVTLTLRKDLVYFDDGRAGWIAWSSSRGPTRDGRLPRLKPDLTAPGENITSALRGTGSGAATWSGTSMASPTAAGLLTLLRQARPAWEPWEIKAWAMSTASPDPVQWTGAPPLSPARQGAGRIHATRALETELLAYDAEHPLQGSVTFEILDVLAATEEVRTVRVENRGAVPRTFDVAWEPAVDLPGAAIVPGLGAVTIPPGESVDIPLTLSADPALLRSVRDPNMSPTAGGQAKLPRAVLAEESGHLVLRDGGAVVLRVAGYAAPRPASELHATSKVLEVRGGSGAGALSVAGTHLAHEGPGPEAVRSLVTPFELLVESPDEAIGDVTYATPGFPPAEVQAIINAADLRAVGLTSDWAARVRGDEGLAATTLYLALATWGVWGSPAEVVFLVEVDRDGDGANDGYFYNSADADAFFVVHVAAGSDEPKRLGPVNVLPGNRVTLPVHVSDTLVLPIPATALGLTEGASEVGLRVSAYHAHHHGIFPLVDATEWLRVDPARAVFEFPAERPGLPVFPDRNGATIPYRFDTRGIHPRGVMLLHHHNPPGERVDLLEVSGPGCWRPEDCPEGSFCVPVLGRCAPCLEAAHCGPGERCDGWACVEACVREDANACAEGLTCDALSGRCGACVYNEQCPSGTWCDPGTLRCVECVESWECGAGEWCHPKSGACVEECRNPEANPCSGDLFCHPYLGLCTGCVWNAHCTGGRDCVDGACVPGPPQGPDTVGPGDIGDAGDAVEGPASDPEVGSSRPHGCGPGALPVVPAAPFLVLLLVLWVKGGTRMSRLPLPLLLSITLLVSCDGGSPRQVPEGDLPSVPDAAADAEPRSDVGADAVRADTVPDEAAPEDADLPPPEPATCGHAPYTWLPADQVGAVLAWEESVLTDVTPEFLRATLGDMGYDKLGGIEHPVRNFRFRYTTQDKGMPVEATAMVGIPTDMDGEAPLPVLLWLHPTMGWSDACAPSADPLAGPGQTSILGSLGYIVVAPDYLGMRGFGEPSPPGTIHPYLVAEPTALVSLDAVRAALAQLAADPALPDGDPSRVVLWGASQGGHAAFVTERYQPWYAPELHIAAAAASVPGTDLIGQAVYGAEHWSSTTEALAAALVAHQHWYGQGDLSEVLTDEAPAFIASTAPGVMASDCGGGGVFDGVESPGGVYSPAFLAAALDGTLPDLLPWGCFLAESSVERMTLPRVSDTPFLATFGELDDLVQTSVELEAMIRYCGQGYRIEVLTCAGLNHQKAVVEVMDYMRRWTRARLDGDPWEPAAVCAPAEALDCAAL